MVNSKNDALYHHGIKGMRWGVRRYKNEDGSLTNSGQKRYERDQRENSGKKKGNRIGTADPDRWVREDLDRSKKLTDASNQMTRELSQINKKNIVSSKKVKLDLSKMTDAEMREKINRSYLEKQYTDMFSPQQVSKGKLYTQKVLETVGSTLAVTSSALGIALAIKELRG